MDKPEPEEGIAVGPRQDVRHTAAVADDLDLFAPDRRAMSVAL